MIKPRESALAHKAVSLGVVALSTVRLGESQFKTKGMPPSNMVRLARGGKGAEGVVSKSKVADPEIMGEKGGGFEVERRVDTARLSTASMAGRQDCKKVEFQGVKMPIEGVVLLLHSPLTRSREKSGSVQLVPAGKPAMPANKEGLLRLPLTMPES